MPGGHYFRGNINRQSAGNVSELIIQNEVGVIRSEPSSPLRNSLVPALGRPTSTTEEYRILSQNECTTELSTRCSQSRFGRHIIEAPEKWIEPCSFCSRVGTRVSCLDLGFFTRAALIRRGSPSCRLWVFHSFNASHVGSLVVKNAFPRVFGCVFRPRVAMRIVS